MRSLIADSEYFAFLDGLRDSGTVNTTLAASYLAREFPNLRAEEAKAICADWRATYHGAEDQAGLWRVNWLAFV